MKTKLILVVALLLIAAIPVSGIAVVDGDPGEWDLSLDHFAVMYEGGDPTKEELADLYLRYHCPSQTLSALVLLREGLQVAPILEDAHLKLNDSTIVDGTYPDFAWVGDKGYEASAVVQPASYSLDAHIQVLIDDRTAAVKDRSIILELNCTPTAITLSSFDASTNVIGVIAIVFALGAVVAGLLVIGVNRNNDKQN